MRSGISHTHVRTRSCPQRTAILQNNGVRIIYRSVGMCRAEKLLFITTRGGDFSIPEISWMEMGARQLEALCAMYGIPSFQCLTAQGLDDIRNDKTAIMVQAIQQAEKLAETF